MQLFIISLFVFSSSCILCVYILFDDLLGKCLSFIYSIWFKYKKNQLQSAFGSFCFENMFVTKPCYIIQFSRFGQCFYEYLRRTMNNSTSRLKNIGHKLPYQPNRVPKG